MTFSSLIMLSLDKPLLLADAVNNNILYGDLHYYVSAIPSYVFEFIFIEVEHSTSVERVLDWGFEGFLVWVSWLAESLFCVLEQDTFSAALYCFNLGRPVPTVLVQPRKTRPHMTEKLLTEM